MYNVWEDFFFQPIGYCFGHKFENHITQANSSIISSASRVVDFWDQNNMGAVNNRGIHIIV